METMTGVENDWPQWFTHHTSESSTEGTRIGRVTRGAEGVCKVKGLGGQDQDQETRSRQVMDTRSDKGSSFSSPVSSFCSSFFISFFYGRVEERHELGDRPGWGNGRSTLKLKSAPCGPDWFL